MEGGGIARGGAGGERGDSGPSPSGSWLSGPSGWFFSPSTVALLSTVEEAAASKTSPVCGVQPMGSLEVLREGGLDDQEEPVVASSTDGSVAVDTSTAAR
eukprot:7209243-Pyramimonas_sp.AAC.1